MRKDNQKEMRAKSQDQAGERESDDKYEERIRKIVRELKKAEVNIEVQENSKDYPQDLMNFFTANLRDDLSGLQNGKNWIDSEIC